tara:strand:- start:1675 stop:2880 length:1206 start_codon:yes stop_codon:yes gene_type:complete
MANIDWKMAGDHRLKEFCAGKQAEKLDRIFLCKGFIKSDRAAGISAGKHSNALNAVLVKAAQRGYTPVFDSTRFVDPGQQIIGKSTYTKDDEGNPVWIKTKAEREKQSEAYQLYIDGLCEEIKPAKKTKISKKKTIEDLMPAIFIGDAHMGLYAYAPETKHSNFTTDIASQQIRTAIDYLVANAPTAEVGLLAEMGDFIHMNSSLNKTLKGTELDVDGRYERVLHIAGETMQYCIRKMLTKFKKVIVVIVKGNHDTDPAVAIQQITTAYYHKEPRVEVLRTASKFHYLTYGKWLIGFNHGDSVKPAKLVSIMARDMPKAWGESTHRMWALGHFHHQDVLELDGCIVQKFGALPPPDAWHSGMGFSSGQVMQMVVFRKSGGREATMLYELEKPVIAADYKIA